MVQWLAVVHACCRDTKREPSRRLSRDAPGSAGRNLAPEVEEFHAFVDAHGETGGWDADDHEEFVKIVKACGGDYTQAVEVCLERCVGFTKSEIITHARWELQCSACGVVLPMPVAE